MPHGEVQQVLHDPNAIVDIAIGPPAPDLVPQQPGTGLILGNQIAPQPLRFIFKKAHLSREDFRIFDAQTKRLVCVSHHHGKNPYESLDPLGVAHQPHVHHGILGEMESICHVTGYSGMPSFKVRPSKLSMHGRQLALDPRTNKCMFSVCKRSRIKTMSVRHNLEVSIGDDEKDVYILEADLMGRTVAFKNMNDELIAIAAKSTKALVMSQVVGSGSEMIVDVAPGVDWTAVLGIMMVMQQVGAHYVKDLFAMFVMDPLKDSVVDSAVEATGMQGAMNTATHMTNNAIYYTHQGQRMQHQFQQANQYY